MSTTDPFVTADWLADHPDAVVVDCRWYLDGRSAVAAYEAGHLPGARFVDLDADLSAPPGVAGRHPLPEPAVFGAAMQRIGVHPRSLVVAYDDTGGYTAGRLWWMLDSLGVTAFVLAGGIATYGGELEVGPDEGPSGLGSLVVERWPPHRFATIDEVDRAIGDSSVTVVDARSAERFSGAENPIDARFGHVPGAVSVPALGALDAGLPRRADALVAHFEAAGVDRHHEVIAYCGSGVSACLDLLALRRAGHDKARLYVGSWSEWGGDPHRPLETGQPSG